MTGLSREVRSAISRFLPNHEIEGSIFEDIKKQPLYVLIGIRLCIVSRPKGMPSPQPILGGLCGHRSLRGSLLCLVGIVRNFSFQRLKMWEIYEALDWSWFLFPAVLELF
ncbi:hypothetical protein AKJ16_DCAP05577 [Drosera capensis]